MTSLKWMLVGVSVLLASMFAIVSFADGMSLGTVGLFFALLLGSVAIGIGISRGGEAAMPVSAMLHGTETSRGRRL